jgi:serine/threonine protein kinase
MFRFLLVARQIVEIGRVIGGHYLLQRLIKQGQYAVIYQGVDQAFQRAVAVKAVDAAHIPVYRAAVRRTSQFTFPNMVGLYDLVTEQEKLYLIQEYIDGDDFSTLLQSPLQPYEVADYGHQICLALLYASGSSRKTCHGDLTPTAIMRDRRGQIRVNNFALPSDVSYFTVWSNVGGEGLPLSDRDLPWGAESQGRRADDTRAVGLLLYQLLAGRLQGATVIEPPAAGRLRFRSNVPPELCNVVARTIIHSHPQHINTVAVLNEELKTLAETLEPATALIMNNPAHQQAPLPPHAAPADQAAEVAIPRQFSPAGTGKIPSPLPAGQPGSELSTYQQSRSEKSPASTMETPNFSDQTVADPSLIPSMPRPSMPYPITETGAPKVNRTAIVLLLLLGLLVFGICFAIGYYGGTLLGPH